MGKEETRRRAAEQRNAEAVRLGAEFRKGAETTQGCGNYASVRKVRECVQCGLRKKYVKMQKLLIPEFRPRKVSARFGRDSDNLREDLVGRIVGIRHI
jgi:hypothetical protein